jgi:hypothetical protein
MDSSSGSAGVLRSMPGGPDQICWNQPYGLVERRLSTLVATTGIDSAGFGSIR